jgi:hypothetical protein
MRSLHTAPSPAHLRVLAFACLALLGAVGEGAAQQQVWPLVNIGSPAEDRLRTRQLTGEAPTDGFLVRSTASLTDAVAPDTTTLGLALIPPELLITRNSKLPGSGNDGSLWAGRGDNFRIMFGARAIIGHFRMILAPEYDHSQNQEFSEFLLWPQLQADSAQLRWRVGPLSADLPARMGTREIWSLGLGQSSLSYDLGSVAVGASTENLWWGPGIRNSIILSNNAPGFPHLFLKSAKPIRTGIGDFEGMWISGTLRQSGYFDDAASDPRSISAIAATWRLAAARGLTLGAARSVYSRDPVGVLTFARSTDAFTRWRHFGPDREDADDVDAEQILSLFGRWVFPEAGLETYAEWARTELPASLRSLLLAPERSQGYTVGLQWARPAFGDGLVRVQGEATYLENSGKIGSTPTRGFYVGERVPQGYTNDGQSLGAAIGPGSSGQWLALDYLASRWRLGAFLGRVRWDASAFEDFARWPLNTQSHDVSILSGLRGGVTLGGVLDVEVEYAADKRMNYLFQNWSPSIDDLQAMDVHNRTLRLSIIPLRRAR